VGGLDTPWRAPVVSIPESGASSGGVFAIDRYAWPPPAEALKKGGHLGARTLGTGVRRVTDSLDSASESP
jgi:hypothetical protein